MTRRIVFTREYNHRWPSRAITHFKVTGEPITVKAEVAEIAIAKGYAEPAGRGKAASDGETQRPAPGDVAGCDPATGDDDLDGRQGDRRDRVDDRGDDDLPAGPGA
jgi:hypothetical protein